MITIDIGSVPPPEIAELSVGDVVLLGCDDARCEATLTSRWALIAMPIVGAGAILRGGTLLAFSIRGPQCEHWHGDTFDPPIYTVVIP